MLTLELIVFLKKYIYLTTILLYNEMVILVGLWI